MPFLQLQMLFFWIPKLIYYGALLATVAYLFCVWRRSGNWGFLLLAITSSLAVVVSLASTSILALLGGALTNMIFVWWSATMAALGVIAWRKICSSYALGATNV